jgi:hypothetical protein
MAECWIVGKALARESHAWAQKESSGVLSVAAGERLRDSSVA